MNCPSRNIRRKDRALSEVEARSILAEADYGMFATQGEDGWPYAVPVNHVLDAESNTLYFHCAKKGHKLDNLRHSPKVCFSAVKSYQVLPEDFATNYASACAFGFAEVVQRDERARALRLLVEKYCKGFETQGDEKIQKELHLPEIVAIRLERITGKARRS